MAEYNSENRFNMLRTSDHLRFTVQMLKYTCFGVPASAHSTGVPNVYPSKPISNELGFLLVMVLFVFSAKFHQDHSYAQTSFFVLTYIYIHIDAFTPSHELILVSSMV